MSGDPPGEQEDPGQTLGMVELEVPTTPALPLEQAFVVGEKLGEGGMSVVRRGVQRSLGREVAIKSTREHASPGRLVAEGRITGALEHPHIVPVHDVVQDRDGALHIVLKQIDGLPWSDVMHDPGEALERFGVEDLRAWNLDVLEAVARAVEFAHAQGILHRDLKPDNVMVGGFGQVYVVDWGVAVRVDDLRADPAAHRRIVGTPRYMAPELAQGRVADQGPATDVYLLGAILYEIVTGMGPHLGFGIRAILERIPGFLVEIPGEEPELVGLLQRAMASDPENRPPSVAAFLRDLRRYRRDRAARALLHQAEERGAELQMLLSNEAPSRTEVYQVFGALRFGLEEAERQAPELAGGTLREASLAMARWELEQGEDAAAEGVLAGLEDVPAELVDAIATRRAEREARDARLRALESDVNPWIGRRSRNVLVLGLSLFWTLVPLINAMFELQVYTTTVLTVGLAASTWALRDRLLATQRNRTLVALVASVVFADVIRSLGRLLGGPGAVEVAIAAVPANAAITLIAALLVDRRFLLPAATYAISYLAMPWLLPVRPLVASFDALVMSLVALQVFEVSFRRP